MEKVLEKLYATFALKLEILMGNHNKKSRKTVLVSLVIMAHDW